MVSTRFICQSENAFWPNISAEIGSETLISDNKIYSDFLNLTKVSICKETYIWRFLFS